MTNNSYGMPITIKFPLDLPNVDLMFWMNPFTTDTLKKRYQINYPNSSLYIQRITSYSERQSMDPNSISLLSFRIYENNLDEVKDIFKEALSWFTDEAINILYGENDTGMLMFNSEYNTLGAIYVEETGRSKTALKIVPTVVEIGQDKYSPGVVFYINQVENGIVFQLKQFKRLANFILNFNFIPYDQFAMQCFQHCVTTGALLTQEQVQQRLDYQRQYNTNFKY